MGDQSLGRLIRKRRDALGFSQARLGELVGRSASTIRNWERDKSTPSTRSDAVALAAVLGLDEFEVLDRAGFDVGDEGKHETVEQAYASLAPNTGAATEETPAEATPAGASADAAAEVPDVVVRPEIAEMGDEPADDEDEQAERTRFEPAGEPPSPPGRPGAPYRMAPAADSGVPRRLVAVPADREPRDSAASEREVGRAAPPTVLEAAAPEERSYIEDPEERQRYRLRYLGTAALVLFLVLMLLWSFDRAVDALGTMWEDFVGMLEI